MELVRRSNLLRAARNTCHEIIHRNRMLTFGNGGIFIEFDRINVPFNGRHLDVYITLEFIRTHVNE